MNGRERVLTLLDGGTPDCLPFMPITMMFAADHAGVAYRQYATDYRSLVEAQLRIAKDYDCDHVSCISDPGREAADCGATLKYFEDQPPAIDESHAVLADSTALARLALPDPLGGGRMRDRVNAVALFKQRTGADKLIEGWVEGPCAEAADLRGINTLMMDFYEDPNFVRDLFEFVTELGLRFGRAQIDAGADIIGVGDAAASLIGPELYEEFVWPYEHKLISGLHEMGGRVRLHICGNTSPILQGMGRLGCAIVDLDFPAGLAAARAAMGPCQTLLGNIDPVRVLRDGAPDSVFEAIAQCHRDAGSPYIAGAGCEVPRGTPPENFRAMHRYARSATPHQSA
ncbi:MAG: uroporphyrinogen decarboxylase family protein [Candidatus Hydrogenedentes bacterium]|nr:uroporphyrinogen decarboxylase family protein [Candidatus Hydrogenedentota bacterium]